VSENQAPTAKGHSLKSRLVSMLIGLIGVGLGVGLTNLSDMSAWLFMDWLESREQKNELAHKINVALEEIDRTNELIREKENWSKQEIARLDQRLKELRGHVLSMDEILTEIYGKKRMRARRNLDAFEDWLRQQKNEGLEPGS
jgi:hypothetical protein